MEKPVKVYSRIYGTLLTALVTAIMLGCSNQQQQVTPTEDTVYLTPIPQETLMAYKETMPITSKLHAVIAAQAILGTTRMHYTAPPQVVLVEETNLGDAHKRVKQHGTYTYEDRPGNTKVWFVVFEGDWQIIPPDPMHTITPPPPSHGCAYVIIEANEYGRAQIGGINCPSPKP